GIAGLAMPGFWLGTLFLLLPSLWLGWAPPLLYQSLLENPWDNLRQFIFPVIALGAYMAAVLMRITRSQMLEVLRQDYIRTAWAKGLRERRVMYRHALKNAAIPVFTVLGNQFGHLLGGTVIMESIFALPGVGRLTLNAVTHRDYPQIQVNVLFIATMFVLVNLVVDLMYAYFDPRIRYT
ncbi:MAG: ABC transporter permease, partial [Chloroflexi bacterium]|nr:ABC transporter permease [Chloroflexota bacterium]